MCRDQLYYQNYLKLTPVLTMIRFIPMFVTGCLCNFFVAIAVANFPLVIFVCEFVLSSLVAIMTDGGFPSDWYSGYWIRMRPVCACQPCSAVLGIRVPVHCHGCIWG